MRYTLLEDPVTHRFAFLPLPSRLADVSEVPALVPERWFASHAEAIAALAGLFDLDESHPPAAADEQRLGAGDPLATGRPH
jgi:hypothetical protein